MNKAALAVLGVICATAIGACGSSSSSSSINTQAPSPEQAFLTFLHQTGDNITVSDADLVSTGHSVRNALDRGLTFDDVAQTAISSGLGTKAGGDLISASVLDFCPKYTQQAQDWANANGG